MFKKGWLEGKSRSINAKHLFKPSAPNYSTFYSNQRTFIWAVGLTYSTAIPAALPSRPPLSPIQHPNFQQTITSPQYETNNLPIRYDIYNDTAIPNIKSPKNTPERKTGEKEYLLNNNKFKWPISIIISIFFALYIKLF
jgi:hypothetical protein